MSKRRSTDGTLDITNKRHAHDDSKNLASETINSRKKHVVEENKGLTEIKKCIDTLKIRNMYQQNDLLVQRNKETIETWKIIRDVYSKGKEKRIRYLTRSVREIEKQEMILAENIQKKKNEIEKKKEELRRAYEFQKSSHFQKTKAELEVVETKLQDSYHTKMMNIKDEQEVAFENYKRHLLEAYKNKESEFDELTQSRRIDDLYRKREKESMMVSSKLQDQIFRVNSQIQDANKMIQDAEMFLHQFHTVQQIIHKKTEKEAELKTISDEVSEKKKELEFIKTFLAKMRENEKQSILKHIEKNESWVNQSKLLPDSYHNLLHDFEKIKYKEEKDHDQTYLSLLKFTQYCQKPVYKRSSKTEKTQTQNSCLRLISNEKHPSVDVVLKNLRTQQTMAANIVVKIIETYKVPMSM